MRLASPLRRCHFLRKPSTIRKRQSRISLSWRPRRLTQAGGSRALKRPSRQAPSHQPKAGQKAFRCCRRVLRLPMPWRCAPRRPWPPPQHANCPYQCRPGSLRRRGVRGRRAGARRRLGRLAASRRRLGARGLGLRLDGLGAGDADGAGGLGHGRDSGVALQTACGGEGERRSHRLARLPSRSPAMSGPLLRRACGAGRRSFGNQAAMAWREPGRRPYGFASPAFAGFAVSGGVSREPLHQRARARCRAAALHRPHLGRG